MIMNPGEILAAIQERFRQMLALPIRSIRLIHENKYCAIYLGQFSEKVDGEDKCILKHYFGDDHTMAAQEARALNYYSQLVEGRDGWMTSRCLAFSSETNLLAIQFVPGIPFSRFVYRARRKRLGVVHLVRICHELGEMLRRFHDETANPMAEPSDVLFDYMRYISSRLENQKRRRFDGYCQSAEELIEGYLQCGVSTTFCHGDFVMRNIHIDTDKMTGRHRIGLIDFGNSLDHSHVLGDLFGFYFSAMHTYLPKRYRRTMVEDVVQGLVGREHLLQFPEAAVRFHFEYHRRRWMMLKMQSKNPLQRRRAIRYSSKPMPELGLVRPIEICVSVGEND